MQMPAVLKHCEDVRDYLMDYLDGKLPKSDAFIFRLHMFLCSKCTSDLGLSSDTDKVEHPEDAR